MDLKNSQRAAAAVLLLPTVLTVCPLSSLRFPSVSQQDMQVRQAMVG